MRKTTPILALAALLALAGCPESNTDDDAGPGGGSDSGPGGSDAGPGGSDAGPGGSDAGPGSDDAGPGGGGLDGLVINEIDSGDEWTELYNGSSNPIDLGGYKITDRDDMGMPRPDRAFAFPDGFTLAPGEYILAIEGDPPEVGVISTTCAVGTRCLHTDWGISGGDGETIFILDASDAVVLQQELPAAATADGNTWCRIPNATGDFAECTPTPEAANMAAP